MSSPQKRVLCLHGYSQNASMFSKKLAALRQQLTEVELVFIDALHVLQPVDLPAPSQMGYFSGFDSEPPLKEPQRGWWKTQNVQSIAAGLEVTLAQLKDVLKEQGVFNGVLGFSQGAVLAALLSGLLEKPETYPLFVEDGKAVHPPLFVSAYSTAGTRLMPIPLCFLLLTPNFKTPTLHVIGHNDIIVTPERSQSLIDASLNGRVEFHDGGHFVPSKTAWRKFLAEYIRNPSANTPGPNGIKPASNDRTPISEPVMPILE
ncbi:serine hydrolase FSH [Lentinula lateritia]|nr:serine hydrolase FSH [Lentinula lateritia]